MALVSERNTASKWQSFGTAAKSPVTSERVLESDGARNLNNSTGQSMKETNFRRRSSGGGYDIAFPLSQRLLSALITEREDNDEACVDRDSDSPWPLSSHSEMDYDRRDAEGESDVDNLKAESDWWSSGARLGGYSESSPMSGGQRSHLSGEDQGLLLTQPEVEYVLIPWHCERYQMYGVTGLYLYKLPKMWYIEQFGMCFCRLILFMRCHMQFPDPVTAVV